MTDPDNLIEAAAQAFADEAARQENCPPANLSELSAEHRRMFLATIKVSIIATLEGIREATQGMEYAGAGTPLNMDDDIGCGPAIDCWQRMLTTLLASMKDPDNG